MGPYWGHVGVFLGLLGSSWGLLEPLGASWVSWSGNLPLDFWRPSSRSQDGLAGFQDGSQPLTGSRQAPGRLPASFRQAPGRLPAGSRQPPAGSRQAPAGSRQPAGSQQGLLAAPDRLPEGSDNLLAAPGCSRTTSRRPPAVNARQSCTPRKTYPSDQTYGVTSVKGGTS